MSESGSTELDTILDNLEKATSSNNYWDSSAYATQALEYVDANGMNPDISEEIAKGLLEIITAIRDTADLVILYQKEAKKLKKVNEQEFKDNLIDEIVNFKG